LLLLVSILSSVILSGAIAGCAPGSTDPEDGAGNIAEATNTAPAPTVQAAGRWEIVLEKRIEQPLRIAAFLDKTFGLTGGPSEPGMAHYTTDGGQTWTMADNSAA
jgi:hypothetical protein